MAETRILPGVEKPLRVVAVAGRRSMTEGRHFPFVGLNEIVQLLRPAVLYADEITLAAENFVYPWLALQEPEDVLRSTPAELAEELSADAWDTRIIEKWHESLKYSRRQWDLRAQQGATAMRDLARRKLLISVTPLKEPDWVADELPDLTQWMRSLLDEEDVDTRRRLTDAEFDEALGWSIKRAFAYAAAISDQAPLFDRSASLIASLLGYGGDDQSLEEIEVGLAESLITSLPSFPLATMDELLDIRSELSKPLIRFRAEVARLAESVAASGADDFDIAYRAHVAPALLALDEEIQSNRSLLTFLGATLEDAKTFVGGAALMAVSLSIGSVDSVAAGAAGVLAGIAARATTLKRQRGRMVEQNPFYFLYRAESELNKRGA
jgi:hypothetical protein